MSTSNGESAERQRDGWEEKGAKPSSSTPVENRTQAQAGQQGRVSQLPPNATQSELRPRPSTENLDKPHNQSRIAEQTSNCERQLTGPIRSATSADSTMRRIPAGLRAQGLRARLQKLQKCFL